jgi:hypothetical protein
MAVVVRKKQLLKQSSKLAQAQSYPTLIQSKGYKYLLYKALETLRPGSIHECSAYELRQAMGFHDYKELQAAIEGLSAVQIRWETLGRSDVIWGRSSLLSSCVLLENGNFRYSFDPQTVQELIQPSRYRRLNLELMLGFQSNYALKIYEGAWHFFDPKKRWGRTPGMTRDKLREWLSVPEGCYKTHRDFFRRAVTEPLKEVNARGELVVTFHHDNGKPRARLYWFEVRADVQRRLLLGPDGVMEELLAEVEKSPAPTPSDVAPVAKAVPVPPEEVAAMLKAFRVDTLAKASVPATPQANLPER